MPAKRLFAPIPAFSTVITEYFPLKELADCPKG